METRSGLARRKAEVVSELLRVAERAHGPTARSSESDCAPGGHRRAPATAKKRSEPAVPIAWHTRFSVERAPARAHVRLETRSASPRLRHRDVRVGVSGVRAPRGPAPADRSGLDELDPEVRTLLRMALARPPKHTPHADREDSLRATCATAPPSGSVKHESDRGDHSIWELSGHRRAHADSRGGHIAGAEERQPG